MDWQQLVALLIVAGTAGTFVWNKTRRHKLPFRNDTHCGCASSHKPALGSAQTIKFHARKGERPSIVIKNSH